MLHVSQLSGWDKGHFNWHFEQDKHHFSWGLGAIAEQGAKGHCGPVVDRGMMVSSVLLGLDTLLAL